ncbi:hypothetical protein FRC12_004706 [Ceratobasidium sp. 428]|nr:hypothetical protein FRC12_004706 [Ceratobasidium sp. 428]
MAAPSYSWNLSPGHRVLKLPELARLICSSLDRGIYIHLLHVSRDVYASILPMVWEVTLLKSVLFLIPGVETSNYVIFPPVVDLTRLNAHAQFVKTLNATTSELYCLTKWPEAIPKSMLPNLRRLVLNSLHRYGANWISRLLNPNLRSFEMAAGDGTEDPEREIGEYPWLNLEVYTELLNQLSRSCPLLEVLQVFPVFGQEEELCDEAYMALGKMAHLQSVTLIVSWIPENLLRALGQLPHLKNLSLWTSGITRSVEDPLEIPDNSFLSLQRLSLVGIGELTIKHTCAVPSLFRNLTQADLIFNMHSETYLGSFERSTVAVKSLGQNTPYLEDLAIRPRGSHGGLVICSPVVDAFKLMHLRRLRLGYIAFSLDGGGDGIAQGNSPEDRWTTFLAALPFLEELHLEEQSITPEHLAWFAALLFRLSLLEIRGVDLGKAPKTSPNSAKATQRITVRAWSCFVTWESHRENTYMPDEPSISTAARYLCDIWPNVTCESTDDQKHCRSNNESTFARLNAAIMLLRPRVE